MMTNNFGDTNNRTVYLECPPLGVGRVTSVRNSIEKWVRSSALSQLVNAFDSKVPINLTLDELVEWLLNFSEKWDFRKLQREATAKDIGEGARWLLDDTHLTMEQKIKIEQSAKELGLIGIGDPAGETFDFLVVLGGARLSCLLRPRLAAKLIRERKIQPKEIVLLSSSRPIANSERDATDTYDRDAKNEFDLMNTGIELALQLPRRFTEERFDDPTNVNKNWVIRKYDDTMGLPPIVSISAPSSEPNQRRANSADTFEFFFSKRDVPISTSLLLVTSQIYVPYQQLEAIRTLALPHKVIVETVGFPVEWAGELQGMAGPTNYLQEIRSTIQSASRFIKSFPNIETPRADH